MLLVTVEMKVKEGCMEEFLKCCEKLRVKVLAERGCAGYEHARPVKLDDLKTLIDPNLITMVEQWETEESFIAHGKMPHMKEFAAEVKEMRESVEIKVHRPIFE